MDLLNTLRRALRLAPSAPLAPAKPAPLPLLEALRLQLMTQLPVAFPVLRAELHDQYISLAPYDLLLDTQVFKRTPHPQAVVLGLGFRLRHSTLFPAGMVDCLAGLGTTDAEALEQGVQNYLDSVLRVVLEALKGHHVPALDIAGATGAVRWHPLPGNPQVQGTWVQRIEQVDAHHYLNLLQPQLQARLTPQPFHWLKVYASRLPNGEFVGECQWDNEAWEEGLQAVEQDAAQWPRADDFAGWKQFVLFRRCGAEGEEPAVPH